MARGTDRRRRRGVMECVSADRLERWLTPGNLWARRASHELGGLAAWRSRSGDSSESNEARGSNSYSCAARRNRVDMEEVTGHEADAGLRHRRRAVYRLREEATGVSGVAMKAQARVETM